MTQESDPKSGVVGEGEAGVELGVDVATSAGGELLREVGTAVTVGVPLDPGLQGDEVPRGSRGRGWLAGDEEEGEEEDGEEEEEG